MGAWVVTVETAAAAHAGRSWTVSVAFSVPGDRNAWAWMRVGFAGVGSVSFLTPDLYI